jgi:hypothetical protein
MIEITRFRLKHDHDVDEFVDVNARYQTQFAYQQRGLHRRTVALGLLGEWVSISLWQSKKDVHRAEAEADRSALAAEFEQFLEPSSKRTEYFQELSG